MRKCVKHAGQIFSKTKELNISKRKHYITACVSHHWSPSYNVEVVEKAFGVVDGWTQKRVWFTPLTIQIFAVQVTAISEETDNNKNKYLHCNSFVRGKSVIYTKYCNVTCCLAE